jgi:mono/diheme cytochrome c family protein
MAFRDVSTNLIRVATGGAGRWYCQAYTHRVDCEVSMKGLGAVISSAAALMTIVSLAATAPAARAMNAGAQGAARTVWDASYTAAQATRGREAYLKECGSCHSDNLQGGDEAPGLVGAGFLSQWVELSAGDLVERTRMTMPQDRPGQLSRASYADIIAYIFKMNGFPAGDVELPTESSALKAIMIVSKPEK